MVDSVNPRKYPTLSNVKTLIEQVRMRTYSCRILQGIIYFMDSDGLLWVSTHVSKRYFDLLKRIAK